ncbi:hypothetical protein A0H81_14738 [Grifola frondosa]|uniref:Uncharacterized protein n=1 Tax=Grifola frondosa TaxID=5627 RepID=A0A1C7LMR9_GRIFR|nr:hypothetical protein A0H81_14738 [Grifola frondosa]
MYHLNLNNPLLVLILKLNVDTLAAKLSRNFTLADKAIAGPSNSNKLLALFSVEVQPSILCLSHCNRH